MGSTRVPVDQFTIVKIKMYDDFLQATMIILCAPGVKVALSPECRGYSVLARPQLAISGTVSNPSEYYNRRC
jgi:hypothetical protein